MDAFIDEVVRRSIRHTRLMLRQGSHNWPVARLALRKILADLETSAPDDPSLQRLRTFIASTGYQECLEASEGLDKLQIA
jgi:hypothetical protein